MARASGVRPLHRCTTRAAGLSTWKPYRSMSLMVTWKAMVTLPSERTRVTKRGGVSGPDTTIR